MIHCDIFHFVQHLMGKSLYLLPTLLIVSWKPGVIKNSQQQFKVSLIYSN